MMKDTQYHINQLRRQKMTWQQIGDLIGISRALAWRVGHGKCDSLTARHYFGLPPKLVEVEPCRVCGEVHTYKACPNPKDKGRYRRAAEFTPERVELFDLMLEHLGQSFTEWMNDELDIWLNDQKQSELNMKYMNF